MANKRHVEYSTEELEAKKMLLTPAATKRANINAAKSLRDFLRQKRQAVNFEDFTPEQLNEVLGHFYMGVRTEKNELYRGKSMQALRYGLNRYLSYPPYNKPFNIMTGSQFHSSNELFKVAMQELKAEGKADVKHTPAINQEDLKTLYASKFMSPNTPTGLLNKVQFDVRFYFFRRGLENFEKMTKDTFEVKIDQTTGKQYVIKRFDELTKNHRAGDEELVTGVMPETGDSSCPVYSYNKYLSLLNPKCERLWQFPVNTFHGDDETWYDNRPMGVHTMKKFMAKLSELCQLSQIYTNHSVRATGATLLADKNFSPIDIISVTGHKTVNSLQPYQKTSTAKKLEMAAAMSSQLTENRQLALLPSHTSRGERAGTSTGSRIERGRLVASATVTSQQTIRQDVELSNDEVAALFDPEYEPAMPPTRPNPPMFHHCDLSHATISIQFH